MRLPDEVVDVRRDHITVPVHDARRKRAQLGKPKLDVYKRQPQLGAKFGKRFR